MTDNFILLLISNGDCSCSFQHQKREVQEMLPETSRETSLRYISIDCSRFESSATIEQIFKNISVEFLFVGRIMDWEKSYCSIHKY